MFLNIRVWWLKRRLRSAIYRFEDNYVAYQCGKYVLDEITGGRYSRDLAHIEALKDKLRAIDPKFPKAKNE